MYGTQLGTGAALETLVLTATSGLRAARVMMQAEDVTGTCPRGPGSNGRTRGPLIGEQQATIAWFSWQTIKLLPGFSHLNARRIKPMTTKLRVSVGHSMVAT